MWYNILWDYYIFKYYKTLVVNAEKEILIASGFWKNGEVVNIMSEAFVELNNRLAARGAKQKVVVKIIWGRGSFRYGSGDYKLAIDLVASGKVDVKSLITTVVPFSEAERAFEKVASGQVVKILIAGPNQRST